MTPIHILTYLGGEQDAQFAIVRITSDELTAIYEACRFLTTYQAGNGGYCTLHHCGNQHIEFIKDFPEGFGFGLDLDADPYLHSDTPVILPGYAELEESFLAACESGGHSIRSASTGFAISLHGGIGVRGYEKHCDELLHSFDIAPAITAHLAATYPDDLCMVPFFQKTFPNLTA